MLITRFIYPLTLRDRVSYKVLGLCKNKSLTNVSTHFGRNVKLDLLHTDFGHRQIFITGFYELELSKRMAQQAKKGGVLFDVGANFGYYSTMWASLNKNNKVFAFEASPLNIGPLQNNVDKNKAGKQIEVLPFALGKEQGNLKFSAGREKNQSGWGGLTIDNTSDSIEVNVETLDNFTALKNIEMIDVLKIDTEGADTWVLYGAEKLLTEKRIKNIYFEVNLPRMKKLNISPREAPQFLKEKGYKVTQISNCDYFAYL